MQLPRKMSANVMASISRTLGNNRHDGHAKHSNEVKLAGEESKDKLYEPKHRQKVVRVLTVVAYVVSVSLAAIILSLYYTFIWDPKDHAVYALRRASFNSTSRVECLNVTIPVIGEHAKMINGSNNTRIPITQFGMNDTLDLREPDETTNQSDQLLSPEVSPDLASGTEQLMESARESPIFVLSPLIVQRESSLNEEERKSGSDERLTEDTSDFDFI